MFDFLKKKKEDNTVKLVSPLKGDSVEISNVNDPTFAEKMLGDGIAIKPSEGVVCSPVDGTIDMVFDTKHAVSITSDNGVGVGMSEDNDGTGAVAALASWLMMTTLLSTGFVTTIMPSIAKSQVKTLNFQIGYHSSVVRDALLL